MDPLKETKVVFEKAMEKIETAEVNKKLEKKNLGCNEIVEKGVVLIELNDHQQKKIGFLVAKKKPPPFFFSFTVSFVLSRFVIC